MIFCFSCSYTCDYMFTEFSLRTEFNFSVVVVLVEFIIKALRRISDSIINKMIKFNNFCYIEIFCSQKALNKPR